MKPFLKSRRQSLPWMERKYRHWNSTGWKKHQRRSDARAARHYVKELLQQELDAWAIPEDSIPSSWEDRYHEFSSNEDYFFSDPYYSYLYNIYPLEESFKPFDLNKAIDTAYGYDDHYDEGAKT